MKQTLIKLVDEILRQMEEHPDAPPTENGIRSWLKQQGYNKRDIEDAIRLIRPRVLARPSAPPPRTMTVRPLSDTEGGKFTAEARNAFARLEMYALIDPYEREMILERLHQFEGEVGLEELDYLLSWVVCGNRDVETQRTMYGVLGGQGGTFH